MNFNKIESFNKNKLMGDVCADEVGIYKISKRKKYHMCGTKEKYQLLDFLQQHSIDW